MASENSGGGTSKIVRANTREDRVISTTKKEPEFTGPSKYSPYVPPVVKSEPPKKSSTSSKAIADAFQPAVSNGLFVGPIPLGTVRTETGYEAKPIAEGVTVSGAGPTNFIISSIVATPSTPTLPVTISTPPPPVKTATLDVILFDDETTPIDTMADLIFENIGGQELINITRSDIVNGQKISYQPIKNLSSIQQRYNPNNILSLQQTSDKYFAGFSIKLEDKIPNEGNGINGENIYIEESTGDLIIEFININSDEQIELQITTDGTIYEADLGEIAS